MKTKKIAFSALLISAATLSSHLIFIPVGGAKCFPVQHAVNVLSAVLLGPGYAVMNAFLISLLRNILGTGSILAFPGSMIGALAAGTIFKKTGKMHFAALGEAVGTGILGGIAAYPFAKFMLGKEVGVFFFVIPFLVSTVGGSIIGYLILKTLERSKAITNLSDIGR